jgi:hypothetical protein
MRFIDRLYYGAVATIGITAILLLIHWMIWLP